MYSVFCKQKAAYEVGMSDWSSDVCSSDLHPLDASAVSVALSLPGSDLAFELRAIVDAKVQALASQDTDLDLGHVEPAGVLRREVELQPAEEAMGLRRGEGLVESPGRVRGQVVHDHPDLVSVGEADVDEIAHLLGKVDGRAPPGDRDLAPGPVGDRKSTRLNSSH